MPTEIYIDPNVRVRGGQTYSAFRHVIGDMPRVGDEVFVREPESNLVGTATVADIDQRDHLIYLSIDWAAIAPEKLPAPDELMAQVATVSNTAPTTTAPAWRSEPALTA